jgi:DNA methylase
MTDPPPNTLYINDNLITLKSLPDNSVDCVITDPPYFTGNKKLTYSDSWKDEQAWIDFITPRLIEVRRVMKPSATMLINIDQNMMVELHNIIYKIFGKKNVITTFIWKKKSSCSAQSKFATVEHEYIIAVAKDIKKAKWNGVPQFEDKNSVNKEFVVQGAVNENYRPNQDYPLYHGDDPNDLTLTFEQMGNDGSKKYRPNQDYPLYHDDDGTALSQRFDKTSKTDRNPETRPEATYSLHYGDKEYPFQERGNGKGPNQHYPLHTNKTKISLTPFPGSIEVKPMNGKELGCWRAIPATCQKLIDADMLVVKNGKIYQKQYAHYAFDRASGKLIPTIRTTPVRTILLGFEVKDNE